MILGVRFTSVNLSGETTSVTFNPLSGGTLDLGLNVFPFNYYNTNPYGIFNFYVEKYDHTYTTLVSDPTPLDLTLEVEYSPGSIIAEYTLISDRYVSNNVSAYVENILEVFTGSPINISTGVTITFGNLTGQTIVTVDGDYDNTTGVYLFGQLILSGAPSGSTGEIVVINPKPTPDELIDPIITNNNEYISVGGEFYLQYAE